MKANVEIGSFNGKIVFRDDLWPHLEIGRRESLRLLTSSIEDEPDLERATYRIAVQAVSLIRFKDCEGKEVTVAGQRKEDALYNARLIRTPKPPAEKDEEYGEEYWNNRVPKAYIEFTARRVYGFTENISVDVRQMITPKDGVIFKDLRDHDLIVGDPQNCDRDIFKIYRHTRLKPINPYKYEYDTIIFGTEFFMYPYELRILKKGDCDDWGIELASYLIVAGVPSWRVRCVVGKTWSGEGHLTVYVLGDGHKTWYHLNSTTPWSAVEAAGRKKLADFPKTNDPHDKIGIKDVWFSFNDLFAWHAFETHSSQDEAERVSWSRNFRIRPVFD